MYFGLAQLYVTVTLACMSIKQVLGGVALVIVTNLFPLLYCYNCRGSFTCMFVDRMLLTDIHVMLSLTTAIIKSRARA